MMREKILKYGKVVFFILVIFLIKLCFDYYRFNNLSFKLNGRDEVYLTINDIWNDPGYVCAINGKNRNDLVEKSGIVESKVGTYLINYVAKIGLFKKNLTRKIHVLNADDKHFYIKLNGNSIVYVFNGKNYIDDGVIAYDEVDGILTNKVAVNSNLNKDADGKYEITYAVINSASVIKTIKRTVVVYSFAYESSLKNKKLAKEEVVTIKITDSRYKYTLLPNGKTTSKRIIEYSFQENGMYSFVFYDSDGNSLNYDLEIKNIDHEPPTCTCTLSLYDTSGKINVEASDDSGIKEYIYYYGSNKSSPLKNNSFTFNTLDEKASVQITDMAGNSQIINCSISDKSSVIQRSYNSYQYNSTGYWVYIPKTTKRTKLPVLLYLHGDGSRGNDVNIVNNYAFPKFIRDGEDFPFIMIAPQCHKDENFTSEGLMGKMRNIIDIVANQYNVDKSRIMISGGSSGARGAYKMAATYKNLFSGIVIGSGSTSGVVKASELTYLPVYIFHGINDNRINFNDAKARAKAINEAGGNATFVAVEGGHEVTETYFKEKKLINWMISQVKK